jgi:hypothetical protein
MSGRTLLALALLLPGWAAQSDPCSVPPSASDVRFTIALNGGRAVFQQGEIVVVAFIDRINIAFAALTMNRELSITSQQFGLLAGIFFVGYVIFEVPSNLLMHKIGARIWIARILVTWGIIATLTGFAHNVTELCVARFLLGVAEAGFFPGIVLYLTYWFRQGGRRGRFGGHHKRLEIGPSWSPSIWESLPVVRLPPRDPCPNKP